MDLVPSSKRIAVSSASLWSMVFQVDGTSNDSDDMRTMQSADSCSGTQPLAAQGGAASASTTAGVSGNTVASGTATTGKGSPKPMSAANKKELLKGTTSVRWLLQALYPGFML